MVVLKDICSKLKMEPKQARRILRKHFDKDTTIWIWNEWPDEVETVLRKHQK